MPNLKCPSIHEAKGNLKAIAFLAVFAALVVSILAQPAFSRLYAAPLAGFKLNTTQATANQAAAVSVALRPSESHTDVIVDVEIYDPSGTRVFQQFFEHQNLYANQDQTFTVNWTPSTAGSYQVRLGVFSSNWSQTIYWENSVGALQVGSLDAAAVSQTKVAAQVNSAEVKTVVNVPQELSDVIVDIEIYSRDNQKVHQHLFEHQSVKTGIDNTFTFSWPQSAGDYKIKLGIFSKDWSRNLYWNDNVLSFTAGTAAQVNQPVAVSTPVPSSETKSVQILQPAAAGGGSYTVGNNKVYKNGNVIKLQGASWFGFENQTQVPHGLWARNWQDMIKQMKSVGFNTVRIAICPNTLRNSPVSSVNYDLNPDLKGKSSLDLLDKFSEEFNRQQMYIMYDMHTQNCREITDLWAVDGYSQEQWIDDLKLVANRYKNLEYFVGIDIKNEPKGVATWGTGDSRTDWKSAAEIAGSEILKVNRNILIFVQGIQDNPTCSNGSVAHWWGGNFEPAKCHPIDNRLLPDDKIVYTPHVYGPDVHPQSYFNDGSYPNNLPAVWDAHFGFLQSQGKTLAIGEFGGKYGSGDQRDKAWQDAFTSYLTRKGICNYFYWSWNPNSSDTGGILNDDWTTVRWDKVEMLKKYNQSCN